jgi:DNA-binding CsgD family transcriptional regulator
MRIDFESLLYRIHASADAVTGWSDVLALLRAHFDTQLATLSQHHFASGRGTVVCQYPESADFRSTYTEYASRNPWFLSSDEYVAGRVVTGDELLSNRDLIKTDFYRDLLRPHGLFHCMSGVAARRGSLVHFISLHRSQAQPAFGEREKANLKLVLGHVSLALENQWRLREASDLTAVLKGVIDRHPHPALLVNPDCCVVHRSRNASALSLSAVGLCIEGNRLVAATALDRTALRDAIGYVSKLAPDDAHSARLVTISAPGRQQPAVVSVQSAGKAFAAERGELDDLVLVTARNPNTEHSIHTCSFVKQFRLSPAQARVSVLIVTGHSLADTARKLHVSENTARSHLKQVFQKTNTHGQMELVHLHARNCVDSD